MGYGLCASNPLSEASIGEKSIAAALRPRTRPVAHGSQRSAATSGSRGIAQGLNVVRVSVADVRVEHEVKLIVVAEMGIGVGTIYRVALDGSKIREKVF